MWGLVIDVGGQHVDLGGLPIDMGEQHDDVRGLSVDFGATSNIVGKNGR